MTVKVGQPVSRSKHQSRVSRRIHARMSERDNFVPPEREHAKRIQDERWEQFKDLIVAKYRESTLDKTSKYMEKEFGFKASRRQYVHRLGKQKWNIGKYKGGQPQVVDEPSLNTPLSRQNPASPDLSSVALHPPSPMTRPALDFSRYSSEQLAASHILSDGLLYLGDLNNAFAIKAELYRVITAGHGDFTDQEIRRQLLRRYVIDCICIIQTEADAKAARQMLEQNDLLYERWADTDDNTWESVLFRILTSRTYDSENSESSIIQIVEIINKTTVEADEAGHEKLQTLTPRKYRFDLLMYKIFSFALERYNEPTAVDEIPIDVGGLLKQFKNTQPAIKDSSVDPRLEWELVLKTLDFCVSELSNGEFHPLRLDNKTTRANRIFCTLLCALQKQIMIREQTTTALDNIASDKAHAQFASVYTELLGIVVGLIVDEAPSLEFSRNPLPLKEWALRGAQKVKSLAEQSNLDQEKTGLIDRFLDKANSMNVEIMLENLSRKQPEEVNIRELNLLRKELAQNLGVEILPDLEPRATVIVPLTASWELYDRSASQHSQPVLHLLHGHPAPRGPRSRSVSRSHSPSATSSSQSPATNGNATGQASDASAEGDSEDIILD
ncbi:hypothetical protein QC762_123050 [Podospora pseudocomata]|uniref:Clr5 domain-containing protein n=1 Tax=Podospora pseudocomata TaxID=2093779 RepID=A0ABR0GYL7_9PEZI|nr:hypothetical protein QC762_123050 [Podospora pseudocomata]